MSTGKRLNPALRYPRKVSTPENPQPFKINPDLPPRMHDSGQRQEFTAGAVRDTAEGKSRPDLISPFALWRLGIWLMLGAKKYNERNWEKGIPNSRCFASLVRHTLLWLMGHKGEDHLAAMACNITFLMHNEMAVEIGLLPPEIDDMPKYLQKKGIKLDVLERLLKSVA